MTMADAKENLSARSGIRASDHLFLVLLATAVTLLNAVKPILIDDAVYFLFAEHIAHHPLDPYGFELWGVQSANYTLAPPVLLYWCAVGMHLLGDDPFRLKLWLLPVVLLFVYSLHAIGRRFAKGMAALFVFLVVCSPAVLPCVNLMLDVPSLALAMASVAVFMRACDERSVLRAALAGLIAGLAMETKYTAFTAPAAMLLYSLSTRRLPLGFLAAAIAAVLFLAWERFLAAQYGDSHFWLGAMQHKAPLSAKLRLVQPLFGCLGALVPFLLPMALAVLNGPRLAGIVAGVLAMGIAALGAPESAWPGWLTPQTTGVVFGCVGLALTAAVAAVAVRLIRRPFSDATPSPPDRLFSDNAFLIAWLLVELGAYFAISPYAAARRVMGVVVLFSLLIVRLAAKQRRGRNGLLWTIAGLGALHGLFFLLVDDNWWRGRKELVAEAARVCRAENPSAVVWYFGDTAFDYYASRKGMKRLIFSDSVPADGDWVVVAEGFEDFFLSHAAASKCVEFRSAEWRSQLPLKSQYQASSVPVARWNPPRFNAAIYRVK